MEDLRRSAKGLASGAVMVVGAGSGLREFAELGVSMGAR